MIEVAKAINSFLPDGQQVNFVVPPSELITLTYDQLQDLIQKAVEKALAPLQDQLDCLETTVDRQDKKIAVLEATQDTQADNQLIQLKLINNLREFATKKEPQPLQKDRGEILRALLAANGGKMLAMEARQKMHLSRSRFSELMSTMEEYIETKPYHLNKSAKILILK